jgi:hypothetical protein
VEGSIRPSCESADTLLRPMGAGLTSLPAIEILFSAGLEWGRQREGGDVVSSAKQMHITSDTREGWTATEGCYMPAKPSAERSADPR